MQLNRETLRTVKERIQKDTIPFVSTFNTKKKKNEVFNIINQNLPIFREDRQMKELYSKYIYFFFYKSVAKHYMIPRHYVYFCCCTCFGIKKNINVTTRFDQIHQLFHKILSINIILKSIKGHNSVEKFRKIISISHNMDHISMHK